jgi:hypothetical protein
MVNDNRIFHTKSNLKLRKIGNKYIIVEVCDEHINMSDVYSMNRTAANIWERINKGGCTFKQLVEWICDTYDVSNDTAANDLEKLLEEWKSFGLIY